MGCMRGVLAIVGRSGAVGMCDGISVTLHVRWGLRRRHEGGLDVRWHPCA